MSQVIKADLRITALHRLRRWEKIQRRRVNVNYLELPPLHHVAAMELFRRLLEERERQRDEEQQARNQNPEKTAPVETSLANDAHEVLVHHHLKVPARVQESEQLQEQTTSVEGATDATVTTPYSTTRTIECSDAQEQLTPVQLNVTTVTAEQLLRALHCSRLRS